MDKKAPVISKILEVFVLSFMAVIAFFIIAAFIPAKGSAEANTGSFDSYAYNEGWTIKTDDSESEVTLPVKADCKPGDQITIINILPDDVSDGMTLMLRTNIEDVCVYIDGTLRECYSSSSFKHMSYYLPSAYVVTDIGSADAGKEIKIIITVKDTGVLNEIRLSHGNNAWFKIIRENMVITVIASIVVILSLVTVALYIFFYKKNSGGRSVFYLGLLMADFGLWSLCESRLRQIIFARPSLSQYSSFFTIELSGVLACMFIDEVQERKNHTHYLILESLMSIQIIVNIILSLTGLAELYRTLIFSHFWFVFAIAVIFYNIITDIVKKQTGNYIFVLIGMGIFVLFSVFELINFYINPFRSFGAFICTGLLFLLISTIIQETNRLYRLRIEKTIADAANKAKSDFLASMSHEIRTPINAVLGMNELILRESRDPEITGYSKNIETAGNSLMGIINDILDLSRIESGKLNIINTEYDPAFVIDDACTMIEKLADSKGLKFKIHVDRELPSRLTGDDIRLRQILVNLLTNAVKYTEKGQVILTVNLVKTEGRKAYLNVSVKDTGIGIKPEDCDKLFESFTRLDDRKTRGIEGTGLGLSIVARLLSMMGGKPGFESVYGAGSDFYFDLAQEIADETPIGDYKQHIAQRRTERRQDKYIYAPGARILVIDDRPMNLAVVRGFLKNSGIVIDGALSGEEGILLMKENNYDIVFFDHILPGLDGIETYQKCLKEGVLSKDVPAVMMTANAIAGAADEYLEAGFCGYISKPVTPDELTRIIAAHLPGGTVSLKDRTEAPPVSADDSRSMDDTLSVNGSGAVDISQGLKNSLNDRSIYLTVIDEFLKEQNDVRLKKAYEEKDWDNYRVIVHSMKAGAKYTGANKLHDLAYECEAALKRNDHEFVKNNHSNLLRSYDEAVSALKSQVIID
ncbi:MAG: response regulator [Lachnospiraceae bacterium]|nr:response regulator [Lachnospiraceae bacterium]